MRPNKHPTTEFSRKTWLGKDVYLNVGPREGILRIVLGLIIGGLVFWVDELIYIIIITVVSFYLFITGAMLFCFIKYFWRHVIRNVKDPLVKDPEIPVKKL